ncbi:SCO7613 C-terminal domain-containing membrane protein [Pseudolysinimonas yzui]|uniref:Uncharacterized protein n=1 Tax=Pseudolysinimonas yzui TaxID=2708254 RepID=A0A8J3LYV4_9MICO|nr:hypothetical protein [Pseudolysinimonas yzui]GHF07915.1 hypothetical protein GCM10011600_05850 [Pseudolysinimonas yzui]
MAWSDAAAKYLRSSTSCPRCERGPVGPEHCPNCGAILVGEVADELRAVSAEAAELLTRRQEIIGRLSTKAALAPPPTGQPAAAAAPATAVAPVLTAAPASSSQVSLQSVLAIAGAVLVAVAIVVFRFFNVDVDISARRVVIAVVTVLFLGFAWLLARGRLTFSAEAVGALAMVFVALDIWAISEIVPEGVSGWTFAAIATLIASLLTLLIAVLVRLRVWLWLALVGLIFVPAFFGYAVDGPWSAIVGHLGAVAVALVGFEVARRLTTRFDSPLLADRVTVTLGAALFGAFALLALPTVGFGLDRVEWVLGSALVIAALAALCGVATRTLAPAAWSAFVGALGALAAGILPFALDLSGDDQAWWLALAPAAAAVGLAAIALIPWPARVQRPPVRGGALVVAMLAAVPAALVGMTQLFSPVFGWLGQRSIFEATPSLAAIVGLAAATVGVFALAVAVRRDGRSWQPWLILTAWLAAATLTAAPAWSGLAPVGQAIVGVVIAAGIGLVVLLVPRARDAALSLRAAFLLAAHVILLFLALLSWTDESLTVAVGAAIVATLVVLAMALPATFRPLYVVVGYGYALVLVARGLDLLGLDTIPVIAYTATAASVFALVVTLVRRVRAPLWYAQLAVTAVPFVIGVATMIAERTWETALANAAIFALSLTLTLTRRPGLTRIVRSGAAALLLPSLAVVVVNVIPRIIETGIVPAWEGGGGAPVTLPVIATVVALVLPTTPLIAGSLRRGDVADADVASVRQWIEISAFVTGGITALLSLVLETPDLGTALLVFLIIGIGAAGASIFAKRRYGWWLAAGCWTAALWCVWGLAGIRDVEPYVYPPAVAAVIIGVVLTLRGRAGASLVAPGLAIAIATSLVVLVASGSGEDAVLPWRALALLAASLVLLLIGTVLMRRSLTQGWERLRSLCLPALIASIGAASAGTIQAVRYGVEADDLGLGHPDLVVWPVLTFSVVAAMLAASAGRSLPGAGRWAQVPALVFLVVGPISAVAPGVAPMWVLWTLALVLLLFMLVTVLAALRAADRGEVTILPPTWVVFLAAWCVAVAGWSVRDLNVEWFSLPLGLALVGAGALVLRRDPVEQPGTLTSWPVGFRKSWAVLAPGIVVTVLPSVLATGTNPATWRAILVLTLALVALLAGALLRYAAPFVLSLVTFGVEILVILVVLVAGRDIDPVVFYVAAGAAGSILITVGIWFERRSRGDQANSARMRDLR